MANDTVWPAMASAFERTAAISAERMLAALDAAQAAGGDLRGRQSAAILIVGPTSTGRPWAGADRTFDLRVEDHHQQPLVELRRLVRLQRAYAHANHGDELVSQKQVDRALKEYAAAALAPEILELPFWQAITLVSVGREAEATPILKRVLAKEPWWADSIPRLPAAQQLPDDPALIRRLVALRPAK